MPQQSHTEEAAPPGYVEAVEAAANEFSIKLNQYGGSWLLLRPSSITDQALIKAFRLRKLWASGAENRVGEAPTEDLRALMNYAFMAIYIVRLNPLGNWPDLNTSFEVLCQAMNAIRLEASDLLLRKNHDYDNAWKEFRASTFVDLVLTKLYRIRTLEKDLGNGHNDDKICQEWFDIANYCGLVSSLCSID